MSTVQRNAGALSSLYSSRRRLCDVVDCADDWQQCQGRSRSRCSSAVRSQSCWRPLRPHRGIQVDYSSTHNTFMSLPSTILQSIQPFGHNRHGPNVGDVPLFRGDGSSSNTKSPAPRPTSIPRGILIHPAIWPQQIWAENSGYVPIFGGGSWVPI